MASTSEQPNSQSGRITDKTVYILGAGFSRLAGSPVLNSFIPQAFSYLRRPLEKNQSKQGKRKALLKEFTQIIEKYGKMCLQFDFNVNNIEDIFSLVDIPVSNSDQESSDKEKEKLIEVIIRTIDDSMKCIRERKGCNKTEVCCVPHQCIIDKYMKPRNLKPQPNKENEQSGDRIKKDDRCPAERLYGACVYEGFVSTILRNQEKRKRELSHMDAVITFNWDLLLEEIIQERFEKTIQIYYGINIREVKGSQILKSKRKAEEAISNPNQIIQLLKIHGSFNWRCANMNFSNVVRVDRSEEPWEAEEKTIPLIPPTWKRGSKETDIFTQLIAQAVFHLQTAGNIMIIGYSMPDSDIYFRYLLAKALQSFDFPKIEVWDVQKRELMIPKLEKLFGKRNVESEQVNYFDTGLLGYVTSQVKP